MRVLIAFDKFKDSITAGRACAVASDALGSLHPGWALDPCPLTDGGEGFAEILTLAAGGSLARLAVSGPRGARVDAAYGIVSVGRIPKAARLRLALGELGAEATIGIADMASASGLALVAADKRDLERSSSAGTGELIREMASAGVGAMLLGVGGSATHDLGLGALEVLGLTFSDEGGHPVKGIVPLAWPRVRAFGGQIAGNMPPLLIACDVDNPLLGARGALGVYGPQKGLVPARAEVLEGETARVARLLLAHFGRPEGLISQPGSGAAGGIALGLMAGANAALRPGFELVSSWLDLDRRIDSCEIVITGEGRFDDSSLNGKGPGEVARRALQKGKLVHVFAGQVSLSQEIAGLSVHAVTPQGMALPQALSGVSGLLVEALRGAFA